MAKGGKSKTDPSGLERINELIDNVALQEESLKTLYQYIHKIKENISSDLISDIQKLVPDFPNDNIMQTFRNEF